MAATQKSHVDLEEGGGGGHGRICSFASGERGSGRASTFSDEASSRSPFCSAGGGGTSYGEERRSSNVSAPEIVGVSDKKRESSVSEHSVEVDLEELAPEIKVHLAKSEGDCRICHLSLDASNQESGVPIELGCSCKDDLAAAHRHCAEAWFKIKGNRVCEICGSTACNVAVPNETELTEQWNDANEATAAAAATASVPPTETRNFWQGHRFLNFLLACMVFAFVISWLFHFNIPS